MALPLVKEKADVKGVLNSFSFTPFNMLWMWNLLDKSSGANEISDKLIKFCSNVKLGCLR